MTTDFLDYLADPRTGGALRLENARIADGLVYSGELVSEQNRYPIIRGVPRFVPHEKDNYARSFSYQWQRWPRLQFEVENVGRPMAGHTRKMWERITQMEGSLSQNSRKPMVVDIGCGSGRFSDIAVEKGYRVIAIDYSLAVDAARKNFPGNADVCVVQGDALNLPLRGASIDAAFSIGVLHHTPAPAKGVVEAFKALRKGGWFACAVYGQGGYYDFPQVRAWRKLFQALWRFVGPYPAIVYSYACAYGLLPICRLAPPIGKLIRLPLPFVNIPDRRWALLDTFDSLTPSWQSAHTSYEVYSWFKRAGFVSIEPSNWSFTSYRGLK